MTKKEFIDILKNKKSAPFLFLGSGFTRHYISSAPTWKGLLETLIRPDHINKYYSTLATKDLPTVASAIAKDLTKKFWELPNTDAEMIKYRDEAGEQSFILKARICELLNNQDYDETINKNKVELSLLRSLNIDGIITTNWDLFAEKIFTKFTTFIGQQQLITASSFGVGEIYKIHGCISNPNSLVLTKEDYDSFDAQNPYLAAKLLTIFMEHPIIFIGYSLSDSNIQKILESIVKCLGQEMINKLQNNLFFVDWTANNMNDIQIESYNIKLSNEQILLPTTKILTHDYMPVYECLSYFERKIPANVLREYKKQFYDIVISDKPEKRIFVLKDADNIDETDVQFVCGFGAINKYQSVVGYVGIKAIDLFKDVVNDSTHYDSKSLLQTTIFEFWKKNSKSFIPIYKYLANLNIHSQEQYNNNTLGIPIIPLKGLADFQSYKFFSDEEKQLSVSDAIKLYEKEVWKAIVLIPYLHVKETDFPLLQTFISAHIDEFIPKAKNTTHSTMMRKLICFYDWKRYGWDN